MRRMWVLAAAGALGVSLAPGAVVASAGAGLVTVTEVRAAHHAGFDRYVLQFDADRAPQADVTLVRTLVADASGLPEPVPGRAILRVVVRGAQAHDEEGLATVELDRAFALPNILATRGAGDFEGVVTLGIGLARRMPFHVHRLTRPGRIAIDVSTAFATTSRSVYFFDAATGARRAVSRPVPSATPAVGLLDRIFAGPTPAEQRRGLQLHLSGTTGFTSARVADGIARVQLDGRCNSEGNRFTIADHVIPTLRRLGSVRWVKVHDQAGSTQLPNGPGDSEPACLQVAASDCHYLARDVQDWGTDFSGSFLVAHIADGLLTGTTGAFYSEWTSVRGAVDPTGAHVEIQWEDATWHPWALVWQPDSGTFSGWTEVTPGQLRVWSGGGVPIVGQPCW